MRDYHHVGKRGEISQGRPVRAKHPGRCHICDERYPRGERVIYLPGIYNGCHPTCVFKSST